ncbi:Tyrosinase [Paramyrothecium foliicola]|nr:Tyrosinase [Paramyrothecium foliicola]
MRLSKASKAIFIIINHASATLMPNVARPLIGPASTSDVDASVKQETRSSMLSSMNMFPSLFGRQANNNNQNNAPSCQRCRKKCAKRFIKDPDNCRKCVRCPKGQKGNADSTRCIGENEKTDEEKKKEKDERYKKKKELMKVEYKKNVYSKKKGDMKRDWDEREKKRVDNKNRIKVRFMGRCLTLVPLAMGGEFASQFAGEYFDEAFLEHYAGDMLQHWPEDMELSPWDKEEDVDDGIFADEAFVEQYISHGNEHTKRWINDLARRDPNATLAYSEDHPDIVSLNARAPWLQSSDTILTARNTLPYDYKPGDLIVRNDLEERFFWLIPIFTAVASTLARVGVAAARVGTALLRVAKDTVKVAVGKGSKNSYKTQADGFGKIAKEGNKFWRSVTDPGWWGGYCNHANVLFPTWHRAYLLRLENVLTSIDGCEDVRLPYWDETLDPSKPIPTIFTSPTFPFAGGDPNPLYSYTLQEALVHNFEDADNCYTKHTGYQTVRYPLSGLVGTDVDKANAEKHNAVYANEDESAKILNKNVSAWLIGTVVIPDDGSRARIPDTYSIQSRFELCLEAPNFTVFSNISSQNQWTKDSGSEDKHYVVSLESPHDAIHLAVGGFYQRSVYNASPIMGANGDMGCNETAGFDPVFYFHHCFIDYVFWKWQERHGKTTRGSLDVIEGYPGTAIPDGGGIPYLPPGTHLTMDTSLCPFRKPD